MIDNTLNKRLIFCEVLLVTAISLIFSYVSIGNFEYRQANIHQDNGPTYYSHILNRDHLFEKDINKELSKFWGKSSIIFWGPAFLEKHLSLPADYSAFFIFILQYALILIGVYFFSSAIFGVRILSFTSMLFVAIAWPWGWNLATYPAVMHMPFYTTLSVGLILFSLIALIKENFKIMAAFFFLTGLVHPTIAQYLITIIFIYLFISKYDTPTKIKVAATLACLNFFILLIPIINKLSLVNVAPKEDRWIALTKHMHSAPWENFQQLAYTLSLNFLCFVLFGLLVFFRYKHKLSDFYKRLLLSTLVTVVLFSLLQVISYYFKLIDLVLVQGLRSSFILSIILTPMFTAFYYYEYKSSKFLSHKLTLIWLFLLITHQILINRYSLVILGFLWPVLIAFLYDRLPTIQARYPRYSSVIEWSLYAVITIIIFLGIYYKFDYFFFGITGAKISINNFFLAHLVSFILIILIFFINNIKIRNIIVLAMVSLPLLVFALEKNYRNGKLSEHAFTKDLYEAQIWAKKNTDINSLFLVYHNWKTLSERSKFNLLPEFTTMVYTPDIKLHKKNQFLLRLYGLDQVYRYLPVEEINRRAVNKLNTLNSEEQNRLFNYSEADYWVVQKSRNFVQDYVNLPISFQNEHFIIFRILK